MLQNYAESKVIEALRLNRGHVGKARQQVLLWAQMDTKLLQALTTQHLGGIVAYHVDRVASGRNVKPAKTAPQTPLPVAQESDSRSGGFGIEVLKAIVQEDAKIFGLESYSSPPRRGEASQRHKDAIARIIQGGQGKGVSTGH